MGAGWRMLVHFLLFCLVLSIPKISSKEVSWPVACSDYDQLPPGETLVPGMVESSEDIFDGPERCVQASYPLSLPSGMTVTVECRDLQLCLCSHRLPAKKVQVEICAHLVEPVSAENLNCAPCELAGREENLEDVESSPLSLAPWKKNTLKTTSGTMAMAEINGKALIPPVLDTHAESLPLRALNINGRSASEPGAREPCACPYHHGALPVSGPAVTVQAIFRGHPETDTETPRNLGFRLHVASKAAWCVVMNFGDSSRVQVKTYNVSEEMTVTTFHWYRKGIYMLKYVIYNGCYDTGVELGPYYVDIGHEATSVFMNSSSVHANEVLVFAGSTLDEKYTVIMHHFPTISSYNVSFASQIQVNNNLMWHSTTIQYRMQPISVYTNGTVFATETDITFVSVTKETTLLEFIWYFGEDPPVKTTSRNIKKKLLIPQWYHVTVKATNGVSSVISEPYRIQVQRGIIGNRLASATSALVNASVIFECRINVGTDISYLWSFGDGTVELGNSTTSHIYSREGEFMVDVLAFNNISATSLRKHLFITLKPCQPPPVKTLGPGKVQVWRSQPVELTVTFEATILCDISRGLSYSWHLKNSMGWPVPLPPVVSTHTQTFILPRYFLEPGNYTALAKVQVEGSFVYSNYCVEVEVRARAPVSVISEGTHLFISRTHPASVILRGFQSYDPDYPDAILRYYWACTVPSAQGHPCFIASSPHNLDTTTSTLIFTANSLRDSYDQFIVSLTVSSAGRNSSEAHIFLSTHSDPEFRFIHISWVDFKGIFVNWNEEISFQAECEDCNEITNLSYSWDLFLVNATEKKGFEVPFCRTVGLLESSKFGAASKLLELDSLSKEQNTADPYVMTSPYSLEGLPRAQSQPNLTATEGLSVEPTDSTYQTSLFSSTVALNDASGNKESLASNHWPSENYSFYLPDFEAYYNDIQEEIPSKGRQPGINLPELSQSETDDKDHGDGDNLLGPILPSSHARPTLLVDWPKFLLSRSIFHGYTSSGTMEQRVTIKPYSLNPGETYVLQASVVSKHHMLGKAQLYLTINQAPKDVSCQVQPSHGLEAQTIFSVFCMSGRPDFRYEFSYQIGNSSKHTLYHGRDVQYYFALPAGEPLNNYKVLVSTEVTDGQGSRVQPCTVEVTVLPHFSGSHCPDEDLYNSSLKYLSTLQLMGNYLEIRNYITMINRILSRWTKEVKSSSCIQWSQIQNTFISSVCKLEFTNQEEMIDSILMLRDLIQFPNKLSFKNTVHIFKYSRMMLTQNQHSAKFVADRRSMAELILLIAEVLEVSDEGKSRSVNYLREEGNKIISDILLGCLFLNNGSELCMSTKQMEFCVLFHHEQQSSVQRLGSIQVHLPAVVAPLSPSATEMQRFCCIQLTLFKKNPFLERPDPSQIGQVISVSQYNCSSRRPISRQRLRNPLTVEFRAEDGLENKRKKTTFVLNQDKMTFHKFWGLSENPLESLQIRIEFSKPITSTFPVMILVRYFEKPTSSDFLVKQIHLWDTSIIYIYLPAVSHKGPNFGYLSLLDADYDRTPLYKSFAKSVNYSIHFHWLQCIFWDSREWKSKEFSPQPGTSPDKVNCSYSHLAAFTLARRKVNASFEESDISILRRHPENLLPSIVIVIFMILYALMVIKSKRVDHREKKKMGYIFLQENVPLDHQLYAVVIDTGFRTPSHFSAKVYIVFYGENGLSEPKELYCPEKPLFESNSRHTFILSAPAMLGPLQKIHLWHDSSGPSPAWFVSHVMVKELLRAQGQCCFFRAESWLAVSQGDGSVERELTCLYQGLGFWKLLYSKFTEYLEDFHVWASVYSRPSSSHYLHTPRLTVALALLCVYAWLSALMVAAGQEQLLPGASTTYFTLGYFQMGFLCSLLISPGAQLLSLLFRLSKESSGDFRAEPLLPQRGEQTEAFQDTNFLRRIPDAHETSKKNPSADLSGCIGTQKRITSLSGIGHLPPDLEVYGNDLSQLALGEKSDFGALNSHSNIAAPQVSLEALATCWPWWGSLAWTVCGIISVACGLGTGFLGFRFGIAQCVQWMCLLTVSILCCVFLTQPFMIGLVALAFAWKRKDDKHFFTESLHAATKYLDSELVASPKTCTPLSSFCSIPNYSSDVGKILAARHQARRLRWARPPSLAQLRVTRTRMRREMRTHQALRDISMYTLKLLLFLFIIYEKFSQDEYFLNQALRNEFTRNMRHSLGSLRSVDDWWHWSLTTLLNGLYQESYSTANTSGIQPMALGGKCYLISTLTIKQLKESPGSLCKILSSFPALLQDSFPTLNPRIEDPKILSMMDPEIQIITGSCMDDCELSLGRTRPVVQETLMGLKTRKWIDHRTKTVSIHFSLYNPPTQLFSSVSLISEVLPSGRLTISALVESFTIFHSNSSLQPYRIPLELVFLVLNLIQLCIELYGMTEKGVHNYFQRPRNWLELSIVGTCLAYHITSSHCPTVTGEVMDQLRKGLFQGFVDLSHITIWNQRTRWLQGILSFLLMLKFLCLLGIQKIMAFMHLSLFASGLVGVLMVVAHFHLHEFLHFTKDLTSGTSSETFYNHLFHFQRSQRDASFGSSIYEQHSKAWCYGEGVIFILMTTVWFGMLRSSLMILAQNRKFFQRRFLIMHKDVPAYLWRKVLTLLGRTKMEETKVTGNHNYFLDEFEDLLDELLLKINGLSDCLEFSLLQQQTEYMGEASIEDNSLTRK